MNSHHKLSPRARPESHIICVRDREYAMPYSPFPHCVPSIDAAAIIFDQLNSRLLDEALEFDRQNAIDGAGSMAATVKAACSTYSVGRNKVEPHYGTGYWDHYRFSDSLFMSVCHVEYWQDTRLDIPAEYIVKIRIVLSGTLLNHDQGALLSCPQGMISPHGATRGSSYYIKGKQDTKLIIIHCKPDFPTRHLGLGPMHCPTPFDCFGTDAPNVLPQDRAFPLSSPMYRTASDILNACDGPRGPLHNAYLFSRCLEMASLVIESATSTASLPVASVSLKAGDIRRIMAARKLVEDRYADPPVVRELARMVGVNQTKLKAGFKAVTGMTISQLILKLRMEKAMELLLANACSVSEVSYEVGYGYPANFALAFKKYFGILPKNVRDTRPPASPVG